MTHNPDVISPQWSVATKRIVLIVIVALLFIILERASEIVLPFIWAAILGYILQPAVNQLERRGLRRSLAATAIFLILTASIIGIIWLVVPVAFGEIMDLQRALPRLVETAQRSVAEVVDGTALNQLDEAIFNRAIPDFVQGTPRMALPLAAALGKFLLEFVVFLIGTFFFIRDMPRLGAWSRSLIPQSQRADVLPLLAQISELLGRYVRGQLLLVVIMSIATTISLLLLGLPYAVVLGIITGILETIPMAGPIVAGAIAVVVALGHVNSFGWSPVVYAGVIAVVYTALRHMEDYFVIPLVIGHIVRLHPALVIFSLLAGATAFGLLGVLLAIPTAATARLFLIYAGAKLRDEDPFPRLKEALAEADTAPAGDLGRAGRPAPS